MIDEVKTGLIIKVRKFSFRNRKAYGISGTLAERTCRCFDPWSKKCFRMSGCLASELPKAFDFFERQIISVVCLPCGSQVSQIDSWRNCWSKST